MGADTSIQWTTHTVNVWHGCAKVSPGCKHCYAETSTPVRVKRAGGLELWGAQAARSETKSWKSALLAWNRKAECDGGRTFVFGQSLSDTFEDYDGSGVLRADGRLEATLGPLRDDFFAIIERCPALTFQFLTKRPQNVKRMVPPSWLVTGAPAGSRLGWPAHVWIGATVEDQERADERIPHLLRIPAPVRFLSVEPQIGPVQLAGIHPLGDGGISWVIQGGESGPKARPFDLAWARSLRDQCRAADVPFFMKQMGANATGNWTGASATVNLPRYGWRLKDSHGGDESEWPTDLRGCRAFPEARP